MLLFYGMKGDELEYSEAWNVVMEKIVSRVKYEQTNPAFENNKRLYPFQFCLTWYQRNPLLENGIKGKNIF